MAVRSLLALPRDGRLALLGPVLVLVLGLFAYRPLLGGALGLSAAQTLEGWFFRPESFSPLPALALSAWLLWRRRQRLLALPRRSASVAALALAAPGAGLFLWAQLTGAIDLLLPALASNLLAFALLARGRRGCRALLLPALVLLLGMRLPEPLQHEVVWHLQLWTASGTAWLVKLLGWDIVLGGALLRTDAGAFLVIESCSGLRGIRLLILVGVAVRELFADSGVRQWLLVLLAPGLGYALNVLRVALVTVSANPDALGGDADHAPQGVAVLIAGTAALYALGRWMGGGGDPGRPQCRPEPVGRAPWALTGALLGLLGLLSLAVQPPPREATFPGSFEFPTALSGWRSEELTPDALFVGVLPKGQALQRRYQRRRGGRSPEVVELFVGYEVAGNPLTTGLFSSRLALPGRGWSIEESEPSRLWLLGRDVELSRISRDGGSEQALVYTWRLRDEGLWRETLRSVLALEAGPAPRERPRAVVRVVAPFAHDGSLARDRAKQNLDAFVADFREALADL